MRPLTQRKPARRVTAVIIGGGVADAPGLYVMGLPFMRRRKSSFLFGVEDDAREICDHLVAYLGVGRAAGLRATA